MRKHRTLEWAFAIMNVFFPLMLILSTNTVHSERVDVNFYITEIACLAGVGLAALSTLRRGAQGMLKKAYVPALMLLGYLAVYMVMRVTKTNYAAYILKYLILFPALVFCFASEGTGFLRRLLANFRRIMVALAVLSLAFYLCGSVLKWMAPSGSAAVDWGTAKEIRSFYELHFNAQYMTLGGHPFPRNTGIFIEAPMYSALLVAALVEAALLRRKRNAAEIVILGLAIASTFSVTAIVASAAIVFFCYLQYRASSGSVPSRRRRIVEYSVLAAVLLASILVLAVKFRSLSSSIRMDDFLAGLRAWLDSPWIGNGYDDMGPIIRHMGAFRTEINNFGYTNGIMLLLSYGGLYLFLVYAFPVVWLAVTGVRRRDFRLLGALGVLTLLLFTTNIPCHMIAISATAALWAIALGRMTIGRPAETPRREQRA